MHRIGKVALGMPPAPERAAAKKTNEWRAKMNNQYKVQYTIKGGGMMREEVVSARSDFEARRTVESRYRQGEIYIIAVTKIS